jgi:pyruvate/2-oxoglutarate dehydrogenase complex dihydrolipoamide acyltransferase (E2) component
LKGNEFGHVVITNVGSIGLEEGMAPLPCVLRSNYIVTTGKAVKKPVVINDKIEIRWILRTTYSLDHRFGDAASILPALKIVKSYVEDPLSFKLNEYFNEEEIR